MTLFLMKAVFGTTSLLKFGNYLLPILLVHPGLHCLVDRAVSVEPKRILA